MYNYSPMTQATYPPQGDPDALHDEANGRRFLSIQVFQSNNGQPNMGPITSPNNSEFGVPYRQAASLDPSAPAGAAGEEELLRQQQAVRRTRWTAFYLRLIDWLINAGLLIWQQTGFAPTWGDQCDYDIKVWATVWLATSFLKSTLEFAGLAISLCYDGRPVWTVLLRQPLLDLFAFAWFFYGIFPLFVHRKTWCNPISQRWALFGWILQACAFFLPCVLVFLCVPCLLCLLRFEWVRHRLIPILIGGPGGEISTNQMPTPEDILKRLPVTKFQDAIDSGKIELEPTPAGLVSASAPMPPSPFSGPSTADDATNHSLMLTGGLPTSFGQAMTTLMMRLNSSSATTDAQPSTAANVAETADMGVGTGASANPLMAQSVPMLNKEEQTLPAARTGAGGGGVFTCPICVTEFVLDDEIMQLPCDSRHHVFHLGCIREWLKKSQHCPMCRMNIVDIVRQHEADPEHSIGGPGASSAPLPPSSGS